MQLVYIPGNDVAQRQKEGGAGRYGEDEENGVQ